jgi:hypothetical protein
MPYAEVLTESYVLTRLDLVHEALERHLASGRGSVQLGDESISEDDLRAARDAIGARLRDPEVLRPADEDPGSAPLAYLPRDPIVSCVQHGLERAADKRAGPQLQLVTPAPGREDAVADFDPTEALPAVTDRHIPDAGAATPEERITIDPGSFNPWPEDPIWAAALAAALGWRLIHGRHPFNPTPAVARLADRARIYLLSDWGTGIPRAVAVSRAIRNMLNDCGPGVEQHVIHLGDVYYAGWPSEQRNHVLNVWPVPAGESTLLGSERKPRHVLGRLRLLRDGARRGPIQWSEGQRRPGNELFRAVKPALDGARSRHRLAGPRPRGSTAAVDQGFDLASRVGRAERGPAKPSPALHGFRAYGRASDCRQARAISA